MAHEPTGSPDGCAADLKTASSDPAMPSSRSHDMCLSALHALGGALADEGSPAIAGVWSSTWCVSRINIGV